MKTISKKTDAFGCKTISRKEAENYVTEYGTGEKLRNTQMWFAMYAYNGSHGYYIVTICDNSSCYMQAGTRM
jgi:hypothetical protein